MRGSSLPAGSGRGAWLLAAALAAAGCARDEQADALLGLEAAAPLRVDVARLASQPTAEALGAALALPHRDVERQLGAHRVKARSHVAAAAADGRPLEQLDEELTLEVDGRGAYRLVQENSGELGREVTFVGGLLYVKPRYGRFVRRRPEREEEQLAPREEAWGGLAAYYDLVARYASVRDGGDAPAAGRAGRRLVVALAPTPAEPPAAWARDPQRAWRATVRVTQLTGDLVLDAASGAPLRATLSARYDFARDGVALRGVLSYDQTLERLAAAPVLAAPEAWLPTPSRPRPEVDRAALLDGLAGPPPGTARP